MSYTNIKWNPDLYGHLVEEIGRANSGLDSSYQRLELSGNMPSMDNTILTLNQISLTLRQCRQMCDRLEENLNAASEIIQKQDQLLAGTK